MKRSVLLGLCLSFLFTYCSSPKERIPPVNTPKPPGRMIIYQMLPRLFGNKTQVNQKYGTREVNGVGKFNDITDTALVALCEIGVTHVVYSVVLVHVTFSD